MKKSAVIAAILGAMLSMASTAYAGDLKFKAELSGGEEVPPVVTEGVGEAKFESDGTSVDSTAE